MILQKSVLNLFKLLIICKTTFVFCYTNYNAKNNYSSGKQQLNIIVANSSLQEWEILSKTKLFRNVIVKILYRLYFNNLLLFKVHIVAKLLLSQDIFNLNCASSVIWQWVFGVI